MKKVFSLIVVVVLAITLVGCTTSQTTEGKTLLAVDINPSIEFVLDEDGNVVSYTFNNEDAEIAAPDIDFVGMNYEDAIDAFINAAVESGYIDVETNDNTVIVTIGHPDSNEQTELQENAEQAAKGYLEQHRIGGAVLGGDEVYDELAALAEEYDITIGKARLLESAIKTDETLTYEGLLELSNDELMDIITSAHQEEIQEFIANRKENAIALRNEMRANAQAKNQQHEQDVEEGTVDMPDYDAIQEQTRANISTMLQEYLAFAEQKRNNAKQNAEDYIPDNAGGNNSD